ncbi:MAG TPA: ribosome-associated translation inhibitor RaiA [Candidatus Latescibacteria bacterium]|nr:ribosome-associated translation inhibitor RaiA [Candidatus Latescibacterota bacterium]
MRLELTARHFQLSEPLRKLVDKWARKLERFDDRIIECQVVMDVEKYRRTVEVLLNVNGHILKAAHESHDMYLSLDGAFEKVEAQLKRLEGRLKDR